MPRHAQRLVKLVGHLFLMEHALIITWSDRKKKGKVLVEKKTTLLPGVQRGVKVEKRFFPYLVPVRRKQGKGKEDLSEFVSSCLILGNWKLLVIVWFCKISCQEIHVVFPVKSIFRNFRKFANFSSFPRNRVRGEIRKRLATKEEFLPSGDFALINQRSREWKFSGIVDLHACHDTLWFAPFLPFPSLIDQTSESFWDVKECEIAAAPFSCWHSFSSSPSTFSPPGTLPLSHHSSGQVTLKGVFATFRKMPQT